MTYLDEFKDVPVLPADIRLTKGSVHIIASRAFVDFVVHSETVRQFRDAIKHLFCPDEIFFSSLNHSPKLGVPGAYLGLYILDYFLILVTFYVNCNYEAHYRGIYKYK